MLDVKKSPKASLEDKKFIYLLVGFVLALSLVYIAFEWTNKGNHGVRRRGYGLRV